LLGLSRCVGCWSCCRGHRRAPRGCTTSSAWPTWRRCSTWSVQGSVASSLCTTAHPLYTRFAYIFGASISEATMRPDPRSVPRVPAGRRVRRATRRSRRWTTRRRRRRRQQQQCRRRNLEASRRHWRRHHRGRCRRQCRRRRHQCRRHQCQCMQAGCSSQRTIGSRSEGRLEYALPVKQLRDNNTSSVREHS
jgi:hypothetical protein